MLFFKIYLAAFICIMLCSDISQAAVRLRVKPLFTVTEEYTDNLFLSDNNKEQDIITTLFPGINVKAETRRSHVEFSYELGYSHYKRYHENDTWRHNSSLSGKIGISAKTQLNFQNSVKVSEEPAQEVREGLMENRQALAGMETSQGMVPEKETVRRTRDKYLSSSSQVNFVHKISRSDSLTIAYENDILKNEDLTVRNKTLHKPSIAVVYWPVLNHLGIEGNVSYIKEELSSAYDNPGYSEESFEPSINLTYWPVLHKLSIKTGLSYVKGVANDEKPSTSAERADNWHESIKPSIGMSYLFLHNLKIDTSAYYQKALTYDGKGFTDTSDDFTSGYGNLKITKKFKRNFEGFLAYSQSFMNFKGESNKQTDYRIYQPSAGVKYIMAEGLPLSLSTAYLVRDKYEEGRESAITVNGELGSWRFSRYGSLRFNASSGYNEDNFGSEKLGFGIYYDMGFNISYAFSRYLKGNIDGIYNRNRYLDYDEKRDDKMKYIRIGLGFQPEKWLLFNIDYSFQDVNSTLDEDNYNENRILFKIQYLPLQGIRIW